MERIYRMRIFRLALLITVMLIPLAVGAEEYAEELSTFSLEDLLEVDVVYGASKFEQRTIDAPASITIVRSEEIERHGYQTLAEVFNSVRGFYSSYDRNYHYAGTRGFSRPGDYNSRLLILVDGHRNNDPVYSAAGVGTDYPLDMEVIDRIEIIRGPGSSLYGTSAMFAVVNIITKSPEQMKGGMISGTTGSLGTRAGRVSLGNHLGTDIDWAVSVSLFDQKGDDLFFEEFYKAETNDGIARGLDDDQYQRVFGKLSWQDLTLNVIYGSRDKGIPTGAWDTVFNHDGNWTTDEYVHGQLSFDHVFSPVWTVNAKLSGNAYIYEGVYTYDYADYDVDTEPDLTRWDEFLDERWWVGEFQATGKINQQNRTTFGFETTLGTKQHQKVWDPFDTYLDDQRSANDWGTYAQHEFTHSNWMVLNAGGRYDHYESFGGTFNPRFAAIFKPATGTAIKALYGQAFRAPSPYELYYHDGNFTSKAPDALDPERIQTTSVSLEQYLGRNYFLTTEAFHYQLEDLISFTTDPEDDLLVFENADEAEATGMELELRRDWTAGVTGRLSYAYQETKDSKTDEILSNAPKHLGKLSMTTPTPWAGFSLGLNLNYLGERRSVRGEMVNDTFLTDATLFAPHVIAGVKLSATVRNLFDATYADPGSEEHIQDGIVQNGRTFRVTAGYSF